MIPIKISPLKIIQSFCLMLLFIPVSGQTDAPADTSYFVPWDDNYNLLLAVNRSDISSINLLLNRGASVNTTTADGVTPLMYAADDGNFELVKLLVEKGADINKKPYNGATALIVVSKQNHYEIAEYLVNKKVELNTRDIEGVTAVHYAAAYNNFDVMDMLIFYGADKELADYKGNTPLITAAYNNCLEAVDLLLQGGALINSADSEGFTPLMTALQRGNFEIADFLIDKGADIHPVNNGGFSALAFAVAASNVELTEKLIRLGADVNQKTSAGYSILEIAKNSQEDEIIDLLQVNDAKNNLNPHFNTLSIGPFFDFNFTDYMNGIQGSILDDKYGVGFNGGFGFRPAANRVLMKESETVSYQYWERRYYFYLGLDKKFDFVSDNIIASGPYLGVSEFFTFGGYRGSDVNPPKKFMIVPAIGWFYSNSVFKTWIGYQYTDYKAPEIKPGRFNVGISVNIGLTNKRLFTKRIIWLE